MELLMSSGLQHEPLKEAALSNFLAGGSPTSPRLWKTADRSVDKENRAASFMEQSHGVTTAVTSDGLNKAKSGSDRSMDRVSSAQRERDAVSFGKGSDSRQHGVPVRESFGDQERAQAIAMTLTALREAYYCAITFISRARRVKGIDQSRLDDEERSLLKVKQLKKKYKDSMRGRMSLEEFLNYHRNETKLLRAHACEYHRRLQEITCTNENVPVGNYNPKRPAKVAENDRRFDSVSSTSSSSRSFCGYSAPHSHGFCDTRSSNLPVKVLRPSENDAVPSAASNLVQLREELRQKRKEADVLRESMDRRIRSCSSSEEHSVRNQIAAYDRYTAETREDIARLESIELHETTMSHTLAPLSDLEAQNQLSGDISFRNAKEIESVVMPSISVVEKYAPVEEVSVTVTLAKFEKMEAIVAGKVVKSTAGSLAIFSATLPEGRVADAFSEVSITDGMNQSTEASAIPTDRSFVADDDADYDSSIVATEAEKADDEKSEIVLEEGQRIDDGESQTMGDFEAQKPVSVDEKLKIVEDELQMGDNEKSHRLDVEEIDDEQSERMIIIGATDEFPDLTMEEIDLGTDATVGDVPEAAHAAVVVEESDSVDAEQSLRFFDVADRELLNGKAGSSFNAVEAREDEAIKSKSTVSELSTALELEKAAEDVIALSTSEQTTPRDLDAELSEREFANETFTKGVELGQRRAEREPSEELDSSETSRNVSRTSDLVAADAGDLVAAEGDAYFESDVDINLESPAHDNGPSLDAASVATSDAADRASEFVRHNEDLIDLSRTEDASLPLTDEKSEKSTSERRRFKLSTSHQPYSQSRYAASMPSPTRSPRSAAGSPRSLQFRNAVAADVLARKQLEDSLNESMNAILSISASRAALRSTASADRDESTNFGEPPWDVAPWQTHRSFEEDDSMLNCPDLNNMAIPENLFDMPALDFSEISGRDSNAVEANDDEMPASDVADDFVPQIMTAQQIIPFPEKFYAGSEAQVRAMIALFAAQLWALHGAGEPLEVEVQREEGEHPAAFSFRSLIATHSSQLAARVFEAPRAGRRLRVNRVAPLPPSNADELAALLHTRIASILFPPSERKEPKRWERLSSQKATEVGNVVMAEVFEDWQSWLDFEDFEEEVRRDLENGILFDRSNSALNEMLPIAADKANASRGSDRHDDLN